MRYNYKIELRNPGMKMVYITGKVTLKHLGDGKNYGNKEQVNGEWKLVPTEEEFKIENVLGFRKLELYHLSILKNTAASIPDELCIMGYVPEGGGIKEYVIVGSFDELDAWYKQTIERAKNIAASVVGKYELTINREIEERLIEEGLL